MAISSITSDYLNSLPIDKRLLLERQAISKTQYGQKRLIEPFEENGKIKYRIMYVDPSRGPFVGSSIREVVNTFDEAISKVSSYGVSELASFNFEEELTPGLFRGFGQVIEDMGRQMQNMPEYRGKNLRAQIALHKAEQGSGSVKDFLAKMTQNGTGIAFPTKEGGIAVNYFLDDTPMSTTEVLEMYTKTGKPLLDQQEVLEALQGGDSKLSSLFQKLPKRLKGVMSPREVSLSGELLDIFLTGNVMPGATEAMRMQSLAGQTLNIDNVFEIMSYAYEESTDRLAKSSKKQKDAMKYIRLGREQSEARALVSSTLKDVAKQQGLEDITDLESRLKLFINDIANTGQIDAATGEYGINIAKQKLKKSNFSDTEKSIIKKLFDEIEKGYDGSGLMNIKRLQNLSRHLTNQIVNLKDSRNADDITRRIEYQRMLAQVNQDISQATVRGSVQIGRNLNYKLAAAAKTFISDFDEYALMVPVSGLKPDTAAAAGTAILNLSGLAESNTRVYSDPMLTAFHGGIFGRPEELQMIAKQREEVIQEFRGVIEQGRLNEDSKILSAVRRIADQDFTDITGLPEEQQFSRLLNRDWARTLMQYHQSGVRISDSPQFMNLIYKYYQTELATVRKGMKLPVLADVYRFAIDSESNALTGVEGGSKILGMEPLKVDIDDLNRSLDISKVRIKDHKILFHENDIRKFYESLGGFDLDDKGLPILGTYMSQGKERFGMAIARQPTGAGELIGLTRFEDIDSYREIFGGNKLFMRTLDDMRAASGNKQIMEDLYQVLTNNASPIVNMDQIESAAIDVWRTMYGGQGRKFDKQYFDYLDRLQSISGQKSTQKLSASILAEMYEKDADMASMFFRRTAAELQSMQFKSDILEGLKGRLSAKELEKLRKSENVSQEVFNLINNNKISIESVTEMMQNIFLNKSNKAAQEAGNILGVYINRATIMGQGLFEIEQALGTDVVRKSIQEQLLREGLQLAVLPQETPIDMTQTLTSGRLFLKDITALANTDEATAAAAIKNLYGPNLMNLEEFQSKSLRRFGEIFGFVSAKQGPDFNAVIDESFVSSGKLKGRDLRIVAEGIASGVRRAGNQELATEIEKAIQGDFDQIEQILRLKNFIGVGALSKIQQEAEKSLTFLRAEYKLGEATLMAERERLVSMFSSEAEVAANKILENNSQLISNMKSIAERVKVETDKAQYLYDLEILKTQLGDTLLSNIEDVQKSLGIAGYDLINALEYTAGNYGIRLGEIAKLPDTSMQGQERAYALHRYFDVAAKRRTYEKTTQNAQLKSIVQSLNFDGKISPEVMQMQIENLVDEMGDPNIRAEVISRRMAQEQVDDITIQEKMLSEAIIARQNYESAILADPEAAAFVNSTTASNKILSSADDIADDTPTVVADTLRELSDKKIKVQQTPYERISKDYIRRQLEKPTVRNIAIGAGLLIAGSFAYQGQKDRTPESIQGPPLLPGGSPYDSDYPAMSANIMPMGGQGYSPGISYKVSLYGDRSQIENFTSSASGLTNGNISSTMYNRIPSVTNDPYQTMGRSF